MEDRFTGDDLRGSKFTLFLVRATFVLLAALIGCAVVWFIAVELPDAEKKYQQRNAIALATR